LFYTAKVFPNTFFPEKLGISGIDQLILSGKCFQPNLILPISEKTHSAILRLFLIAVFYINGPKSDIQ